MNYTLVGQGRIVPGETKTGLFLLRKSGDWINWAPGDTIPEGPVDVQLFILGEMRNCNPKTLNWNQDYGRTPTSIVAWRKSHEPA